MATPEKRNPLDGAYQRLDLPRHSVGFTSDDHLLFAHREAVRVELNKLGFIISPDIASATDVVVPANGLVFVPVLIPEDFLPIPDFNPHALSVFSAMTRSRYAMGGLGVAKGGILHNVVAVQNYANRPIRLSKGEAFCYAYYFDGKTMRGEELDEKIGTEQDTAIRVVGEENEDWRKWYGAKEKRVPENLEGIEFMIDPKSRRWIAPSDEPIHIHGKAAENHLRGLLDTFLTGPIPQTDEQMFWVSESYVELYLDSSVHGVLEWFVDENSYIFQTNSTLFKGGNTYGKMRYEIVSPTTKERIPKSVVMRFAEKQKSKFTAA